MFSKTSMFKLINVLDIHTKEPSIPDGLEQPWKKRVLTWYCSWLTTEHIVTFKPFKVDNIFLYPLASCRWNTSIGATCLTTSIKYISCIYCTQCKSPLAFL